MEYWIELNYVYFRHTQLYIHIIHIAAKEIYYMELYSDYIIVWHMIIILHTVICDHYGRLDKKHLGYGLAATRQHLMYIMQRHMAAQSAIRMGTTEPYPFTDIGSFTIPGDDSPSTRGPWLIVVIQEYEPVMCSDWELYPGWLRGSPEH